MTEKTKKNIIKILAAAVITVVYFYAACLAGNIVAFISMSFFVALADGNDTLAWVLMYVPPVLLFAFIDCLLFKPLCKLFGHQALVYAVLSGNFMTLYGIFAMLKVAASSGERYSGFSELGALLLIAPIVCLLGGVLLCFLIRLFKSRKAKGISDSESANEYAKW